MAARSLPTISSIETHRQRAPDLGGKTPYRYKRRSDAESFAEAIGAQIMRADLLGFKHALVEIGEPVVRATKAYRQHTQPLRKIER